MAIETRERRAESSIVTLMLLSIVVITLQVLSVRTSASDSATPPNIVLILADDIHYFQLKLQPQMQHQNSSYAAMIRSRRTDRPIRICDRRNRPELTAEKT